MSVPIDLGENWHQLSLRVYYADTDFSGVVYHARYLEFLERGRTEFLREMGICHKNLAQGAGNEKEKFVFAVRHMTLDFIKSAVIDDLLHIKTRAINVKGARIFMEQKIFSQEEQGLVLLTKALIEIILITDKGRPRRFPNAWVEKFFSPSKRSF